jgi:hypothetical protein
MQAKEASGDRLADSVKYRLTAIFRGRRAGLATAAAGAGIGPLSRFAVASDGFRRYGGTMTIQANANIWWWTR